MAQRLIATLVEEIMLIATETPSAADLSVAERFIDCCYSDDLRRPTAKQMARLVALGLVEVVKPGVYGETHQLRQLLATRPA